MRSRRITTILTAGVLIAGLTGCGTEEPEVPTPPETAAVSDPTETPAPEATPTTAAPSPSTESAQTGQDTDEESGAGATTQSTQTGTATPTSTATQTGGETAPAEGSSATLPAEPAAYADLFVQAWVDQDQALLEQLAGPDVLTAMTNWNGQGWTREGVRQESHGAVIVDYVDEQGLELELWVQEGITQDRGPHAVVSATVSEGAYPIPASVPDYANAFVDAAGTGDQGLLEQLGTDEALASVDTWRDGVWLIPEVTDGEQPGTARVAFPSDRDTRELVLVVDRELAEAALPDAVLSAQVSN